MLALSGSITAGLCLSFQLVTPVFLKHINQWREARSVTSTSGEFKASANTHELKAKPDYKPSRKSYAS